MLPPPPPIIINIQPGCPVFSIDVECVATAAEHNARSVAQIAVVDEWGRPVLNVLIKQEQPVASYITELTGLTEELINTHGVPLSEALAMVRSSIPNNAIIIGTNVLKDIQWMQLSEGVDYSSMIDLTALFRVWNPTRGEFTAFSQDHCAKVWLGIGDRPNHNAMEDAIIAMSLFNMYRTIQWDPMRLYHLQMTTLAAPRTPGFSSRNPVIDGCCMGNRKQCSCGAPFL
jgi:RNA exonuclease 4